MSNADDIAAQIAAALGQASEAVGDGPLLISIVRDGVATGPAHKPTYSDPVVYPNINALFETYSTFERSSSLVESTDMKLLIGAGQGVTPETTDTIRFAGETRDHVIKRIEPEQPGGVGLFYTVHIKG
jgi:hypothetical protein